MTRLLERKTAMEDTAQTLQATPWISTGTLTANTVVKAEPGLVCRLDVEAEDNGGDIIVDIWDSETTDVTDDDMICRVRVIVTTIGAQNYWECPLEPGVECKKGIYARATTGDVRFWVLYK